MRRALLALLAATALAGCEVYQPAAPEEIARARYVSPEPPSVTLMSMVNSSSGRVGARRPPDQRLQQVLYDPAGTFTHPDLPRRGDIHYGMTPRFVDYYERYHARFEYFVETQKVAVGRATADQVIANAKAEGQTMKMLCAGSVADALQRVPPFQEVRTSFLPETLRADFARMAGSRPAMSARSTSARTAPGSAPTRCRSSSNRQGVSAASAGGAHNAAHATHPSRPGDLRGSRDGRDLSTTTNGRGRRSSGARSCRSPTS